MIEEGTTTAAVGEPRLPLLVEERWIEEQARIARAVIDTDDVAWILSPHEDTIDSQRTRPPLPDEESERSPSQRQALSGRPPQRQDSGESGSGAAAAAAAATAEAGAAAARRCSGSGKEGGDGVGDDVSPAPLPPDASPSLTPSRLLRLVGGVDISFVKGSEQNACATLVVLEFPSLETVYEAYERVTMHHPYVSGFLAFREVDHLFRLVNQLRRERPDLEPDVLFVDGNGRLHPRGAGLASHLGVVTGLRTVGLGKTFLHVDGLTKSGVRERVKASLSAGERETPLLGTSGTVWGTALVPKEEDRRGTKKPGSCGVVTNPVFVSIGHRVSLETCVALTKAVGRYRVPEPIRQADMRSREVIRAWLVEQQQQQQQQQQAEAEEHKGGEREEEHGAEEEEQEEEAKGSTS